MENFSYTRLNVELGELRLCTLFPSQFKDEIRIKLTHAALPPLLQSNGSEPLSLLDYLLNTLPSVWRVWKTLEGRYLFKHAASTKTS